MLALDTFIGSMPKVELHVHLEGAIQAETLLKLAHKHDIPLPADDVAGIQRWYRFTDFDHFIDIFTLISDCIRTPEDIELITREFLAGQAAQHIVYSEVSYVPYAHFQRKGLPFAEQLDAINRAQAWAESELGVTMGLIPDISRNVTPDAGMVTAEWAIQAMQHGVIALGLGGPEAGNPPEKFAAAFARAREAGLPAIPHAGETAGAESIWGALRALHAIRLKHGVRCLEDPALVEELRTRQIPLEVCPTSNVCLGVAPDWAHHPLPDLMNRGLYVTLNSDDPAMFNTTLTDEYRLAAHAFGLDAPVLQQLVMNAVNAALLPLDRKTQMQQAFRTRFDDLFSQLASSGTDDR
jgi:adenosine deaminase